MQKKVNGKTQWIIVSLILFCAGHLAAAECGDANSNGTIDIVDALVVAQYYVGLNPAAIDLSASEVNGDGSVTIVDALLIAQYYVGLISSFSGCVQTQAPTATPTAVPTPVVTVGPTDAPITGVQSVTMRNWTVNSTLWNNRLSNLKSNWIPYLYNQCNNTNLAEGGIANFTNAMRKNQGQSYSGHVGYWFSPVWVLGTFETMCLANMNGANFTSQMNNWLPTLLGAQQSNGYMSTCHQLNNWTAWDPAHRDAHEGYVAAYWIDAGIAHYLSTGSTQFLDAAKKLADCWYNGRPGQGQWWDGHQAIKMSLINLAKLTGDTKYASLARTLLEVRTGGGTYDQSQTYPRNQSEAVGHSVRAAYMYAGMAGVAAVLNDATYTNASDRLWDNLTNYKYYLTGGLGSGESSEGFGANYSLPQAGYCESCAGIGNMFFNENMMLLHQDAKYADLLENSLYNNVLGSLDMNCRNFYYQNPLEGSGARYAWHSCPCCVHNIPRVWLSLPRWTYAKSSNVLFVNLFIGSTVDVGTVGGTNVSMTQVTNYPWDGNVSITVNPQTAANFTIKIRSPNRSVSNLYSSTNPGNGITSLSVNGTAQSTTASSGYVTITRTWNPGDKIDIVLPMNIEIVKAISNVAACSGRVAIQRGPLVYCIESVDCGTGNSLSSTASLSAVWDGGLLNGVTKITGTFTNGSAMTAIPYYARMNRGGSFRTWILGN